MRDAVFVGNTAGQSLKCALNMDNTVPTTGTDLIRNTSIPPHIAPSDIISKSNFMTVSMQNTSQIMHRLNHSHVHRIRGQTIEYQSSDQHNTKFLAVW